MKRWFIFILSICLLICLCSCGQSQSREEVPETKQTVSNDSLPQENVENYTSEKEKTDVESTESTDQFADLLLTLPEAKLDPNALSIINMTKNQYYEWIRDLYSSLGKEKVDILYSEMGGAQEYLSIFAVPNSYLQTNVDFDFAPWISETESYYIENGVQPLNDANVKEVCDEVAAQITKTFQPQQMYAKAMSLSGREITPILVNSVFNDLLQFYNYTNDLGLF